MLTRSHFPILAVLLVASLAASGCVRRRMTIRSHPEGAQVHVDDQEIGTTPASASFVYYAPRNIRISKDGYETLTVKQTFSPPWYQYPVVDFFAENLWPWEVRDERIVDFELVPQRIVPKEELLQRAMGLRDGHRSSPVGWTTADPSGAQYPVGPDALPAPREPNLVAP